MEAKGQCTGWQGAAHVCMLCMCGGAGGGGGTLQAAIAEPEGMDLAGLPVSNIQAVSAVINDQLVGHGQASFGGRQLNVAKVLAL